MPYKLSSKQLDDIKTQLDLKIPCKDIANSIPCSYSLVMEIKTNLRVWGTPRPPKLLTMGPKKLITPAIEQVSLDIYKNIYANC